MLLSYQSRTIQFVAGTEVVYALQISLPRMRNLDDVDSAGQWHSSIHIDSIRQNVAASQDSGANCGPTGSDVAAHLQAVGVGFLPSEQQLLRVRVKARCAEEVRAVGARAHLTFATAVASALHAAINVLSSLTTLITIVAMTGKLLLGLLLQQAPETRAASAIGVKA